MRVLMLGPWPINRPRHGGQIRASNIVETYRARGHDIRFMGIFDPNSVVAADLGPYDVGVDAKVMAYVTQSGLPVEWSLWLAFAEVPEFFQRFVAMVREFRPDIVQFEEPYLWPLVRRMRDAGILGGARLVHSSHNFETDHRRQLMTIAGKVDERILRLLAEQEGEIARESDLVVTVSDQDADSLRRLGATRLVVARNGSRCPEATPDALAAVGAYLGDTPYALFVSSAHPPNAHGLLEMAKGLSMRLPGDFVIAGRVCQLLAPHRRTNPLLAHARMLGLVDPAILDALVVRASVIVLPKTHGGGSNLKTSEAVLARRAVVATELAFTGFEDWRHVAGVRIENDPARFWQSVSDNLRSPPIIDDTDGNLRDKLLWAHCLTEMMCAVEDLASEPALAPRAGTPGLAGHHATAAGRIPPANVR